MSVVVAVACVAFTLSCDKDQSQEEDKFDIELLGKRIENDGGNRWQVFHSGVYIHTSGVIT